MNGNTQTKENTMAAMKAMTPNFEFSGRITGLGLIVASETGHEPLGWCGESPMFSIYEWKTMVSKGIITRSVDHRNNLHPID